MSWHDGPTEMSWLQGRLRPLLQRMLAVLRSALDPIGIKTAFEEEHQELVGIKSALEEQRQAINSINAKLDGMMTTLMAMCKERDAADAHHVALFAAVLNGQKHLQSELVDLKAHFNALARRPPIEGENLTFEHQRSAAGSQGDQV